jgi:hypothetical protein
MKALSISLFLVVATASSLHAGAYFAFANQGTAQLITISGDGISVPIGTNAFAAVNGAGPGQVTISLYMQTNGVPVLLDPTAPQNMTLVGTTTNPGSTLALAQGIFNGGNPYVLPSPFDGSFQVEYVYYAETQFGAFGHSVLGTGYLPAVVPAPPGPSFGASAPLVQGFAIIIPEPSTFALGGLGAAMLLLRWRKRRSANA